MGIVVARSQIMPVVSDWIATARRMGMPTPGSWLESCGNTAWFAAESAAVSVVPSIT